MQKNNDGSSDPYFLDLLYCIEHICLNAKEYSVDPKNIMTLGSYRAANSVLLASLVQSRQIEKSLMYDEIPAKQLIKMQFINCPCVGSEESPMATMPQSGGAAIISYDKPNKERFISGDVNPMTSDERQVEVLGSPGVKSINNLDNSLLNSTPSSSSLSYSLDASPKITNLSIAALLSSSPVSAPPSELSHFPQTYLLSTHSQFSPLASRLKLVGKCAEYREIGKEIQEEAVELIIQALQKAMGRK